MKKLGALVSARCCCLPGVDNRQPALQTASKMDRGRVASKGEWLGATSILIVSLLGETRQQARAERLILRAKRREGPPGWHAVPE